MDVVLVYDLEGNYLDEFPDMIKASEALGVAVGSISHNLHGISNYAGMYQFKKKTSKVLKTIPSCIGVDKRSKRKPVAKYYKGNFICVYHSLEEAEENNFIDKNRISTAIANGWKVNQFEFKFIE